MIESVQAVNEDPFEESHQSQPARQLFYINETLMMVYGYLISLFVSFIPCHVMSCQYISYLG